MTALYRRRSEAVEAVQFDGFNAAECRRLTGIDPEDVYSGVGFWAVDDGYMEDAEFHATFEPVAPAQASARERRIARQLVKADSHPEHLDAEFDTAVAEAEAILAQPAPEPAAWVEISSGGFGANWHVSVMGPYTLRAEGVTDRHEAMKVARSVAAALGLSVRSS